MFQNRKRLWLVLKAALAGAVVVGVALHFERILSKPELHPYPFALRAEYLLPAGLLYLLAHCCWASFWVRLLRTQGVPVGWVAGLRAYFISQYGKYVPGKVWVILIRVAMLRGMPGGPAPALAVAVTATYETLISMGTGALVGLIFLPWLGVLPEVVSRNLVFVVGFAALPALLAVVNKLAARRVAKLRGPDAPPFPSPPLLLLAQGLLHGAVGWCLLGISLGLTVAAVAPDPPAWSPDTYLCDLSAVALSYTAGFVVLFAPGGLGVRELILQAALTPRFEATLGAGAAEGLAVVIALVLRLTWTVVELLFALGLYAWRPTPPRAAPDASGPETPHV